MKEILELETRRKISIILKRNPGLHLSKIAEMLDVRISLLEYHLSHMEKHNVITSLKEVGYKRYYLVDSNLGANEKRILAVLRRETPLKIVLLLLKNPKLTHKEILSNFTISPSTLSWHIKRLLKYQVLEIEVSGKEKRYKVTNDKDVIKLLMRYKPFMFKESFNNIWSDFLLK